MNAIEKVIDLPAEQVIPNWVEWFCIDADGSGFGSNAQMQPDESEPTRRHWLTQGAFILLGQFALPDDWEIARWHKEGGKWVRK